MPAPIYNSNDRRHSPEFARGLAETRGGMVAAAEHVDMPARFSAVPHPDKPAMVIVDEETGRSATVGLYAYGATRAALADLFG